MSGSPCSECTNQKKCNVICAQFHNWFVETWNRNAAKLRKAYGLDHEDKKVGGEK